VATLQSIRKILQLHKSRLISTYGLKNIAIFGSYSRNQQNDASDLDILVEFSRPVGIEFIDLAEELEGLLNIKVDLVSRNGVRPEYFKQIESDLNYV
jgi:predicted nucleotidyltransferase